jgi:hypothetical protein
VLKWPLASTRLGKAKSSTRSATSLKPCQYTRPRIGCDLELDRPPGLLLNHPRAGSYFRAGHERTDFDLYQVASPQLAIYREVKEGTIPHASFAIEEETDRPYLSGLQRSLGSDLPTSVPCRSASGRRVIL